MTFSAALLDDIAPHKYFVLEWAFQFLLHTRLASEQERRFPGTWCFSPSGCCTSFRGITCVACLQIRACRPDAPSTIGSLSLSRSSLQVYALTRRILLIRPSVCPGELHGRHTRTNVSFSRAPRQSQGAGNPSVSLQLLDCPNYRIIWHNCTYDVQISPMLSRTTTTTNLHDQFPHMMVFPASGRGRLLERQRLTTVPSRAHTNPHSPEPPH